MVILVFQESYSDVSVLCGDKFFTLHKLVLAACSDYFSEVFNHLGSKNGVIVLKDIPSSTFESLISYMYLGKVNVGQEKLADLVKAAEYLKIKGLAVGDVVEPPKEPLKARVKTVPKIVRQEPKIVRQDLKRGRSVDDVSECPKANKKRSCSPEESNVPSELPLPFEDKDLDQVSLCSSTIHLLNLSSVLIKL